MGQAAAGGRHSAEIAIAVLAALRAVVRRVAHQKINRTSSGQSATVVEGALPGCVARGQRATSWAGRLRLVPAVRHGLRRWEVLNVRDTFGGVWDIRTRSEHGLRSFSRRLGPAVEKEQPVLSISISESSLQCQTGSPLICA